MKARSIILGTRGSALALAQANQVRAVLHRVFPNLQLEIKMIKTSGDRIKTAALARSGIKGFFTKELEQALVRRKIDIAIHSLKDVPTETSAALILSGVLEREDASDLLVAHPSAPDLIPHKVYTSSPRRAFQARLLWPEVEVQEIRGNVETRLLKLCNGKAGDTLLVAAAGLRRLGYSRSDREKEALHFDPPLPYRKLTFEEMLPAPGQGAIVLQIRSDDEVIRERLKSVNHLPSWAAVTAERAFLRTIGGGCAAPVAAYAHKTMDGLHLMACVSQKEGHVWRGEKMGESRNAEMLGETLAREYQLELRIGN